MFVGTETSAYEWRPDGEGWVDITGAAAPVTIYWSAETLEHENTIRFGTYGRGIWDYQLDPLDTGCYPVKDRDEDGVDCETDCDDRDGARYPGAKEFCGNGVDENCSGADLVCEELIVARGCSGCNNANFGGAGAVLALGLLVLVRQRREVYVLD
jgi:hypothetical protein